MDKSALTSPLRRSSAGHRGMLATMIQRLETVTLGGLEQWIYVSGDPDKPLLLFLHGGPGVAQIGFAERFQGALKKHFLMVHWDQRGGGKSFRIRTPDMTLGRYVLDAEALSRYLLKTFGRDKLYLFGHSWGGAFGAKVAQRAPELFHAYVAQGMLVHGEENERLSYQYVREQLESGQHPTTAKRLERLGEPPYTNQLRGLLTERWSALRSGGLFHDPKGWRVYANAMFRSKTYTRKDVLSYPLGVLTSLSTLWDEVLAVDLFRDVPRLEVPFYLLMGRYDTVTPPEIAERFLEQLDAPHKEKVWFEHSAHCPHLEEPERLAQVLAEHVLGEAEPTP